MSPARIAMAVLAPLSLVLPLVARLVAGGGALPAAGASTPQAREAPVATFSIVAFDEETGDLGVAVQSKFFGVGSVVPYAEAGVGAVATQSLANTTYGPRGLALLRQGLDPEEVVETLVADDARRPQRQVGVVGADGTAATFTGEECLAWAGGRTGAGWAVQGNILAGPGVVDAMAEAFQVTDGDLASRMVAALAAGQAAGGDARGRQSAALLVVREGGGYGGFDDRFIDLRVDDHPAPIRELQRLLDVKHGQIARGEAQRLLDEASRLEGAARRAGMQEAVAAAERATRLHPHGGSGWLTLAAARLGAGQRQSAAAAGIQALRVDPWVKSGVLQGIVDDEVIQELLSIEAFRRVWETIPAR